MPGCEIHDDPLAPICGACRARVRERGRRDADRVAGARGALRREARDAGRDHRRHDRRRGPDQGRAGRAPALRRADDPLRPAAAREPGHLRDQRAAGSGGQDPGGPLQHPPGGRRPDQGLPHAPPAGRADGVHREPRGLHGARQDHHAAQGPHRLRDPDALPGTRHHALAITAQEAWTDAGAAAEVRDPGLRAGGGRGDRLRGPARPAHRQALGREPAPADHLPGEHRLERRAARAGLPARSRPCRA